MNFVCTDIDQEFTKKSLMLVDVQKKIRKIIFNFLTAIKRKIFQRSSKTTLRYDPMGDKKFFCHA